MQKAAALNIFIVLKGHYTAVVTPDGHVHFNSTGNPGMATGGSGDVLTGIITGLLAQGYSSKEAAMLGVYLHGLAGDIAATIHSQQGMKAGDIVNNLGNAWLTIINNQ
jgi:ADP-dependent NAD(P)H-hydrate dehydratase / NAD(P)H-hydrate epimerase